MIKYLIVILLYVLSMFVVYGQIPTERQVIVRGQVVDSISRNPVVSATVSIYSKSNGKILKYGFTNNRGGFHLDAVPLTDTVFQLQLSSVGFRAVVLDFKWKLEQKVVDIGQLQMVEELKQIAEVQVNRPPMMMEKDTLVIHPEAFGLQPNAVVEDLLTKVPGIVVWGDGMITVNGKRVANVLVEGKPFFSKNSAVATRNLSAEAVDKVKVYDSPFNVPHGEERLDVDIVLKKDKKRGLFGKMGGAAGDDKRREATFLLNGFDAKNQISIFAGANNTNKVSRGVGDFLSANVYKAGGESLDLNTPLFDQIGLNTFFIGGTKYERKWNDHFNTNVEFQRNDKKSEVLRDMQEIRWLEDLDQQHIVERQRSNHEEDGWSYSGTARYKADKWDLRMKSGLRRTDISTHQLLNRLATDKSEDVLSNLHKERNGKEYSQKADVSFDLRRISSKDPKLELSYAVDAENRRSDQQEYIMFAGNTSLNRLKENDRSENWHKVGATVGLDRLLTLAIGRSMATSLDFRQQLSVHQRKEYQTDRFLDSMTNTYRIENRAISYADRFNDIIWTPAIIANRSFLKNTGAGRNSLLITGELAMEGRSRKNVSDYDLRRIDQRFLFVLPSMSVRYGQSRKLSSKAITLGYRSLANPPQIDDMIALMDTTQKDFNQIGNRALQSEWQYRFALDYTETHFVKNRSQQLSIAYSLVSRQLTDSISYLPNGGQVRQTVNNAGLPFFTLTYLYRRARKIWNRPLNASLLVRLDNGQRYYYNNGTQYKNRRTGVWHGLEVQYGLLEQLKIGWKESVGVNWNVSDRISGRRSFHSSIGFDAVLTWPKRTTLINRFESKGYYIEGLPANRIHLWNIELYYRMLKKEQLEVKFSAYDLLNDNRNIQNTARNNIVRQVNVDNIRQFFLIGVSYYPRVF